jgi:cholesterol transport system auxiliary component
VTGRGPLALAALACLALALGGCVSVLPKTKPAQLYRFGAAEGAPAAQPPGPAVIARGPVSFEAGASTDRILTLTGQSAAYIAGARWIAPAPTLFEEALIHAFQAQGAPPLAERPGIGHPAFSLTLDVQAFEARYDQGPDAAPEAVVQIKATLIRVDDRNVVAEQLISSSSRASDNRVGAIVQAYDAATRDALTKLVAWAGQSAR